MPHFYNNFVPYYDAWLSSDPTTAPLIEHYKEAILQHDPHTTIIYLGLATGRIAKELLENTPHQFIGIDYSVAMIEHAKKHFQSLHLDKRIQCLHQDILSLTIPTSKNLFLLPLRTLGHFVELKDKKSALRAIYESMAEGEQLIFDMELFNEKRAKEVHAQYMCAHYDEENKRVLYNKFSFDFQTQHIDVDVQHATLQDNTLEDLEKLSYNFSWITPAQTHTLLHELGFKNIHNHQSDTYQLWTVTK